MKITVSVTQEDIDLGCQGDTIGAKGGCMVHRAFMRATEGAYPFVSVENDAIDVYPDEHAMKKRNWRKAIHDIRLPEKVSERIETFDADKNEVKPFSFDVDIPIEVQT